jgi:hypothetical protein
VVCEAAAYDCQQMWNANWTLPILDFPKNQAEAKPTPSHKQEGGSCPKTSGPSFLTLVGRSNLSAVTPLLIPHAGIKNPEYCPEGA